jgi:hypothetical protein
MTDITNMKKIFTVALIASTLMLTGCTMTSDTTDEQNGTQSEDAGQAFTDNQITQPINTSINSTVEADVRTTVADVTLWLGNHVGAESVPTQGPDIVTPTVSEPETTVYIEGGFYDFSVTGYNTATGYRYTYDSTTGQYSAG